ncbi:MAG: GNAT family N-acetyltransferase [Anaerolineae bacterium]
MDTDARVVREIEELAMNAWPAAITQTLDGWRLRFNWGVTSRANSVWPNDAGTELSLDERLRIVADFYTRRDAPPQYQISPAACPPHLDARLAQLGYAVHSLTCVQTASLTDVLDASSQTGNVHVAHTCTDAWFEAYAQAEGANAQSAVLRRGIVERIGPRVAFAQLNLGDETAAVGMGVLERGWLGIFNMSTHPACRRRGAATAVLGAMARWAAENGATRAYLQVVDSNAPARGLYEGLGFKTLYHYHYRKA